MHVTNVVCTRDVMEPYWLLETDSCEFWSLLWRDSFWAHHILCMLH